MVEIRQTPLRMTKRGVIRQLGRIVSTSQSKVKFSLGYDMAKAAQRRQWIEAVYVENWRMCGGDIWQTGLLDVAKQVASYSSAVVDVSVDHRFSRFTVPGGSTPDLSWVARLREVGVPINVIGEAVATVGLSEVVTPDNKPATVKVHVALKAYRTDRLDSYVGGFQGQKDVERKIDDLKFDDMWLHQFGYAEIKKQIDHWRGRPETKKGKKCSKRYAEKQIAEFIKFVKWLAPTYPNEFTLPDLSTIDRKVVRIASDSKSNGIEEKFWEPEELKEIFKTAQPMTQLIIGLGLNACSGAAELGRFLVDDFTFDSEHPKKRLIKFDGEHDLLITTRLKKFTHSEALLWPWVAEPVKEQVAVCKANGWKYLFTEDGEPLYRDNDIYDDVGLPRPNTTKPESRFVRRYSNAVNLAFKEKRITTKLSLGKLRKTFSNYLTLEDHADLATLALSHQTDEDQLLKHYANKPHARLFKATKKAEAKWNLTS